MSELPGDLRFTRSHEWVRREEDGTVTIGITDHAQELLGDLVYVELPEIERSVATGEELAVVESVKAASDLYAPVSGEVVEVNETLTDTPELINGDPYGDGWIMRLKPANPDEWEGLLDSDTYAEHAESEDH